MDAADLKKVAKAWLKENAIYLDAAIDMEKAEAGETTATIECSAQM